MAVAEALYDTNVLAAYLFEEEGRFDAARSVLKKHRSKAISIITLHEVYMYSLKYGVEERFLKVKEALERIFKVLPLTQETCLRASHLRIRYRLPEVDSLILATAVEARCRNFYTFDDDFEQLDGEVIEGTRVHHIPP